MKFHHSWFLFGAICLRSLPCAAAPLLTGELSLEQAAAAALEFNPALAAFPARQTSLIGEQRTAGLTPPLTLSVQAEGLGLRNLSLNSGAAEAAFTLSRVAELGDRRASRMSVAQRRIDLLDSEQYVAELDFLSEVVRRFIDVMAGQERLTLAVRARELAEETLGALEPLLNAGQSPEFERLRVQAQIEQARIIVQREERNLDTAKIELAGLWGDPDARFSSVQGLLLPLPAPDDIASLLIGLEGNADIVFLAQYTRLREAELREAQSYQHVNIEWSAGLRYQQDIHDTTVAIGFSLPLGSAERAEGAITSARAAVVQTEAEQQVALNTMRTRLRSLHRALEQAVGEVQALEQEVLPRLESVQGEVLDAYRQGLYSYVDLTSAQRDYLNARASLIETAATAHTLWTEIERLSGTTLGGHLDEGTP